MERFIHAPVYVPRSKQGKLVQSVELVNCDAQDRGLSPRPPQRIYHSYTGAHVPSEAPLEGPAVAHSSNERKSSVGNRKSSRGAAKSPLYKV